MTVRIGIIGSRFVANLHALAVRQAPGAELTAAASPNTEHAWAFHRRYEIPHVFQDYKDMLDSGFVDAVTVACPNDLHCEVTLAAAKAGKHVFVDKPLALNLAGVRSDDRGLRGGGSCADVRRKPVLRSKVLAGERTRGRGRAGRGVLRAAARVPLRPALGVVLGRDALRRRRTDGYGLPLDRVLPLGVRERADRERLCRGRDVRARRPNAWRRPFARLDPLRAVGEAPEGRPGRRRELVGARRRDGRSGGDLRVRRHDRRRHRAGERAQHLQRPRLPVCGREGAAIAGLVVDFVRRGVELRLPARDREFRRVLSSRGSSRCLRAKTGAPC